MTEAEEGLKMTAAVRGKGRPKLNETAEIDLAIREAALQVLLEHGEAATMQAVATLAGLSRKSLYARYPNKAELFLEVIRQLLEGVQGLQFNSSGTAEERLRSYIATALATISRPSSQAIQRLLTMDPVYLGALKSEMLAATRTIFYDPLASLLEEAHKAGEFVVDDMDAAARVVIRLIFTESVSPNGVIEAGLTPRRQRKAAEFLSGLVVRGLAPRAG